MRTLLFFFLAFACLEPAISRPQFAPFGGLQRLRAHTSEFLTIGGAYQDDFKFTHGADSVTLKYHGQPRADKLIVHLDEELAVEDVVCKPVDMAILLKLNSSVAAEKLHRKLASTPSVLLTGGVEWRCRNELGKEVAILRHVTKSAVHGTTILIYTTKATHHDFFSELKVSFSTTKLPPPRLIRTLHTPSTSPLEVATQHSVKRSWGSFFGSVWNSVVDLAEDVADVVETVVTIGEALATGDLDYGYTFYREFERWDYNTSVPFADTIQCSNCYAQFDFDVRFLLDMADYSLNNLELVAEGAVEFNVGSKFQVSESITNSSSHPITTLRWDPIPFTIGGVPFLLQISVPIDQTLKLELEGQVNLEAYAFARGKIAYGVRYDGTNLVPVNTHAYTHGGKFDQLEVEVKADLTLGLLLTLVVEVDSVGYINFGLQPFMEASVDYNSNSGCDGMGGVRAVLNLGITVTVGASINITDVFSHEIGPYALANIKKPIVSGCCQTVLSGDGLLRDSGVPTILSGPLVIGNTWHGYQQPVPDCQGEHIYLVANVSFQYIDTADDGSLLFVVAFSDVMPFDNTWCVQQGLFSGTADEYGNVSLEPIPDQAPYQVGFIKCQNASYEDNIALVTITGTISDGNWDEIDVESEDACMVLTMYRTAQ